jgi:hypothetical protein
MILLFLTHYWKFTNYQSLGLYSKSNKNYNGMQIIEQEIF